MQSRAFGREGDEICGTRRPREEGDALAFDLQFLGLVLGG